MDFVASALEVDGKNSRTRLGLRTAQSGKPSPRVQLMQRTVQRFLLVDAVVALDTRKSLVPQFSESGLLPGGGRLGTKHFEIEFQLIGQLIDEAVGLREEIPGVEQHDRHARHDRVHEMQHDSRLGAEARSEYVLARQKFKGAFDSLSCCA